MSSMADRFTRSRRLFACTLQVLQRQPKLLLFPIVTFACTLVVALFFIAPAALLPTGHALGQSEHWLAAVRRLVELPQEAVRTGANHHVGLTGLGYAYAAAIYLASMFCATFFNVAFYNEILRALAGEAVSLRSGLRFAGTRLRAILLWSLFAGAVGILIKTLEERFGWIGRWVMRLIGMVWSVASVFAIPVIVRENGSNPLAVLRGSASTLRRTWGESLIGYVGITFVAWIGAAFSGIILLGAGALSVAVGHPYLILGLIPVWVLGMLLLGFVSGVVGHIYRGALYVYASEGIVPEPFNAELLDSAWKVRKA